MLNVWASCATNRMRFDLNYAGSMFFLSGGYTHTFCLKFGQVLAHLCFDKSENETMKQTQSSGLNFIAVKCYFILIQLYIRLSTTQRY